LCGRRANFGFEIIRGVWYSIDDVLLWAYNFERDGYYGYGYGWGGGGLWIMDYGLSGLWIMDGLGRTPFGLIHLWC
jgi:hypothetical protein